MSNFGKAVKIIRIEKDSKAKDFAEFVGYASAHYVSDIECGRRPVPMSYLRKFIEYYSLSADEVNRLLDAIALDYREKVRKKLLEAE